MAELTATDLALLTKEERAMWDAWEKIPTFDGRTLLTALVQARRALMKYGVHSYDCLENAKKPWKPNECICGLFTALGQGTEPR